MNEERTCGCMLDADADADADANVDAGAGVVLLVPSWHAALLCASTPW